MNSLSVSVLAPVSSLLMSCACGLYEVTGAHLLNFLCVYGLYGVTRSATSAMSTFSDEVGGAYLPHPLNH